MSDISNSDLMRVLMDIKEDLGSMKSSVVTLTAASVTTASDIKALQLRAARQRGVLAALTTVGTVLGALVGYAVDIFTRGHN